MSVIVEGAEQFASLKRLLAGSKYFAVDKSTGPKPCFLLYRRQDANSVMVARSGSFSRFITAVKKATGLEIKLQKPQVKEPVPAKVEVQPEPEPEVETGRRYWWQDN